MHTVRNSLDSYRENIDLSASLNARKRRQDNLSSSLNSKTLPTLNSTYKVSPRSENNGQAYPSRIEPLRRNGVKMEPPKRSDVEPSRTRRELKQRSDSEEETEKLHKHVSIFLISILLHYIK